MSGRRLGTVIAALAVAVSTPAVLAPAAHATSYRYWTYWHVTSGAWSFAHVGPAGYRPPDGAVEAWRFAVSTGTATAPAPRLDASTAFSSVCGSTQAESGRKRVALVVDFGLTTDAPPGDPAPSQAIHGTCTVLPTTATGWDALLSASYSIRDDAGLICGLGGFPAKGCGDAVAAPPGPKASAAPTDSPATKPSTGAASPRGAGGSAARGASVTSAASGPRTDAGTSSASAEARSSVSTSATSSASGEATAPPTAGAPGNPPLVEGAPAQQTSGGAGSPALALLGLAAVALLGGTAYTRTRRNR